MQEDKEYKKWEEEEFHIIKFSEDMFEGLFAFALVIIVPAIIIILILEFFGVGIL